MGPDALCKKGRDLLEQGSLEEALSCYDQALLARPDDPDILNGKGAALRSLGRYDEALECFNRSLQIDPRDRRAS